MLGIDRPRASCPYRYNRAMAKIIEIHPENPQPRRLAEVEACLQDGGLIAYPTDSSYALGCQLTNQEAVARIRRIRQTDKHHNFTLVCSGLSSLSTYARVDNWAFRLLKSFTPGPYTFILKATAEVPKKMQHPKRRTIGIRVPDHRVAMGIVDAMAEPILSSTLILPEWDYPLTEPYEIAEALGERVDLVVDGGAAGLEATSVVDLTGDSAQVLRVGRGDVSAFE